MLFILTVVKGKGSDKLNKVQSTMYIIHIFSVLMIILVVAVVEVVVVVVVIVVFVVFIFVFIFGIHSHASVISPFLMDRVNVEHVKNGYTYCRRQERDTNYGKSIKRSLDKSSFFMST